MAEPNYSHGAVLTSLLYRIDIRRHNLHLIRSFVAKYLEIIQKYRCVGFSIDQARSKLIREELLLLGVIHKHLTKTIDEELLPEWCGMICVAEQTPAHGWHNSESHYILHALDEQMSCYRQLTQEVYGLRNERVEDVCDLD